MVVVLVPVISTNRSRGLVLVVLILVIVVIVVVVVVIVIEVVIFVVALSFQTIHSEPTPGMRSRTYFFLYTLFISPKLT